MTSLDHLIRDYKEGPEWSKVSHYHEYVRLVEKFPEEQVWARQQALINIDYSIHFHVWTSETFSEWLFYCQKQLGFGFTIELFQENSIEIVMILRKIAN
jgi:hypothetical protein